MPILTATLLLFSLCGLFFGLFFSFNPKQAIEMQKKFYALINWRIEPINMKLEIRNTRLMGIILIIAGILIPLVALLKR